MLTEIHKSHLIHKKKSNEMIIPKCVLDYICESNVIHSSNFIELFRMHSCELFT